MRVRPFKQWASVPASLMLTTLMIALCGMSGMLLFAARHEYWSSGMAASRNLVTSEAQSIGRSLAIYDASLAAAASAFGDPEVAAASARLQQRALFNQIGQDAFLGPTRIIDAAVRVINDSSTLTPGSPTAAERRAVMLQKDNPAGGLLFDGPFTDKQGRASVTMSRRINRPDGRFMGAVIGSIRLNSIVSEFRQLRLEPHDVFSLFLENGTMLAHAPGDPLIGRSIAGTPVMRAFLARRSGTIVLPSALDHELRAYTLTHIDRFPLVLDIGLSIRDLYAPWRRRVLVLGPLIAGMAGLTVLLLHRLQRELDRRLAAEADARLGARRYKMLADNASDVIIHVDAGLVRTYVSPSGRSLGYEPDELLGGTMDDWMHPDDLEPARDALRAASQTGAETIATYRIRQKDGCYVWGETRCSGLPDGSVIAIVRDVDERRKRELELLELHDTLGRLARTDGLTGLQNRRSFDERLADAWRLAEPDHSPLALLLIDIDHFKLLNDTHGHQAGDTTLKQVAGRIQACLRRPGDTASRYGGEEFAVILPNTDLYGAIGVGEIIRQSIADAGIPHAGTRNGTLTVSIGVASTLPALSRTTADVLLRVADEALYAAKAAGRNNVSAKLLEVDPVVTGR